MLAALTFVLSQSEFALTTAQASSAAFEVAAHALRTQQSAQLVGHVRCRHRNLLCSGDRLAVQRETRPLMLRLTTNMTLVSVWRSPPPAVARDRGEKGS